MYAGDAQKSEIQSKSTIFSTQKKKLWKNLIIWREEKLIQIIKVEI